MESKVSAQPGHYPIDLCNLHFEVQPQFQTQSQFQWQFDSMSSIHLTFDSNVLDQLRFLEDLSSEAQIQVVSLAIPLLEGRDISDDIKLLSNSTSTSPVKLSKLCSSASSVLWECSKSSPKDQHQSILVELIMLAGLREGTANTFSKVFIENKRRILALKGSLGISAFSYQNLSWRLEVELAKRSVQVTSEPRYLLRLDLANSAVGPAETAAGAEKYRSHHLQADHASMKLLEQELQRAVDELSSVHCQRINRYMS